MSRVGKLYEHINSIFARINEMPPVYVHMCQVAQVCTLLAIKRGADVELATMAGLLHDIASLRNHDTEPYKVRGLTGENHAGMGAKIAMEILVELGITSPQENDIICRAVDRHNDKDRIDDPIDELLKDADVFSHGLGSVSSLNNNFRGNRWDKVCQEIGINNCR